MIGPPDYNQKYEESPDGMKPHLEASPKQIPRRHYSNRHDDFEYVRRPAPARRVLYEPGDPEFTRGITSKRIGGWAKREDIHLAVISSGASLHLTREQVIKLL